MKTAVEWLVEQILTEVETCDEFGNVNGVELWNAFRSCTDLSEYVIKAKEMEKEQIEEAFDWGDYDRMSEDYYGNKPRWKNSQQYYNETYESKR
jgi:hypothetical protein